MAGIVVNRHNEETYMFTLKLKNTKINKIHSTTVKSFASQGFPVTGFINEAGVWSVNDSFRSTNPIPVSEFVSSRQVANGKCYAFDENCNPSTGAGYLGRLEYGDMSIKTTDIATILNTYPTAKYIVITTCISNSIYPGASDEFENCYIETIF